MILRESPFTSFLRKTASLTSLASHPLSPIDLSANFYRHLNIDCRVREREREKERESHRELRKNDTNYGINPDEEFLRIFRGLLSF